MGSTGFLPPFLPLLREITGLGDRQGVGVAVGAGHRAVSGAPLLAPHLGLTLHPGLWRVVCQLSGHRPCGNLASWLLQLGCSCTRPLPAPAALKGAPQRGRLAGGSPGSVPVCLPVQSRWRWPHSPLELPGHRASWTELPTGSQPGFSAHGLPRVAGVLGRPTLDAIRAGQGQGPRGAHPLPGPAARARGAGQRPWG